LLVNKVDRKTLAVEVPPDATVRDVKRVIEDREGIKMEDQRLVFGVKELRDENNLSDYGVRVDSQLFLITRLPGGYW
jgi:hypothetical protein